MIVEVTGPSGVGKTTYLLNLLTRLEDAGYETGAIHSVAANKQKSIPTTFADLDGQNVQTDLAALPWSISICVKNPRFFFFAMKQILFSKSQINEKIALLRSFARKTGVYGFLSQRKFRNQIICVDEGLFHSAHNFLISPTERATKDQIATFLRFCPRPDALIILTDRVDQLVTNQLARGDLSPRIRNRQQVATFAENAWFLFSEISGSPELMHAALILNAAQTEPDMALQKGQNLITEVRESLDL
ncbi:hypothetical protein GN278_10755 [Rhodobacteraceae bacterium Araon29]